MRLHTGSTSGHAVRFWRALGTFVMRHGPSLRTHRRWGDKPAIRELPHEVVNDERPVCRRALLEGARADGISGALQGGKFVQTRHVRPIPRPESHLARWPLPIHAYTSTQERDLQSGASPRCLRDTRSTRRAGQIRHERLAARSLGGRWSRCGGLYASTNGLVARNDSTL